MPEDAQDMNLLIRHPRCESADSRLGHKAASSLCFSKHLRDPYSSLTYMTQVMYFHIDTVYLKTQTWKSVFLSTCAGGETRTLTPCDTRF